MDDEKRGWSRFSILLAFVIGFIAGWVAPSIQIAKQAAEESARQGRLHQEINDLKIQIDGLQRQLKTENQIPPNQHGSIFPSQIANNRALS